MLVSYLSDSVNVLLIVNFGPVNQKPGFINTRHWLAKRALWSCQS